MNPLPHSSSTRSSQGFAIVIVLALVVLLLGLGLAYFSKVTASVSLASSSANQAKANELALSGFQSVLGDLRREIIAGSTAETAQGVTWYQPTESQNMLPRKNVTVSDDFPSLVRISRSVDPLTAPAVPSLASSANSTTASNNGRSVTLARWNKHGLNVISPTAAPGETTPNGAFPAPDWIYVTMNGAKVLTAPEKVNGRFAYAIYDVGGTLDVNIVGTPFGIPPAERGRKGKINPAQLEVLGWTDQNITDLLGWRMFATLQPAGNFQSGFSLDAGGVSRFRQFMEPTGGSGTGISVPATLWNTRTDQRFLSRQQFLAFANERGIPTSSLPFLGTFSRHLDAPSWSPKNFVAAATHPDAAMRINYVTEAKANPPNFPVGFTTSPNPNRRALGARWPQDATIKDWEGVSRQVLQGEPILKRRFPLRKLDLFRQYDLASGAAKTQLETEIKHSFGLIPDPAPAVAGSKDRWLYDVQTRFTFGGKNNGRLLTLDEVASTAVKVGSGMTSNNQRREPNFFEILRAAILRGEMGGPGPTKNDDDATAMRMALRIGANIIDQYDEDNYPTFLRVEDTGNTETVAGIENLPMVSEVIMNNFRPLLSNPSRENVTGIWEFEVWNPHRNAGATAGPSPTSFRIVTISGESVMSVSGFGAQPPAIPTPEWRKTGEVNLGAAYLSDTINTPHQIRFTSAHSFAEPTMLLGQSGVSNSDSEAVSVADGYNGIRMGTVRAPSTTWSASLDARNYYSMVEFRSKDATNNPVMMALQYFDARTNKWESFQSVGMVQNNHFSQRTNGSNQFAAFNSYAVGRSRIDPRDARNPMKQINPGWNRITATPNASVRGTGSARGLEWYQYFQWPGAEESSAGGVYTGADRIPVPTGGSINVTYPGDLSENAPWTGVASNFWILYGRDGYARRADARRDKGVDPLLAGQAASRPILLNRPFRNVAEMGYAYRALPWRNVNFCDPLSSDAGLLDFFTIGSVPWEDPVYAGGVNLNSAPLKVLQAILRGTLKDDPATVALSDLDADAIALDFYDFVRKSGPGEGPLEDRSDLVTKFGTVVSSDPSLDISGKYPARKSGREAYVRALGDVGETRTWNLMIDLIAQSGQFRPGASTLSQFQVQGEKRFWLHVAIDRFTGELLDTRLEPVYE